MMPARDVHVVCFSYARSTSNNETEDENDKNSIYLTVS